MSGESQKLGRTSYFAMWVDALALEDGTAALVDLGSYTFWFSSVAGDPLGSEPVEIVAPPEDLQAYVEGLIGRDGTVYGQGAVDERKERDSRWEAFALFLIHVDEFFAPADELAGTRWRLDPEHFFVRTA